jgi:D-arabinose 1-dehydrogenase-like Zn-dependent alcohol dehydrogenase
MRLIAERGLHQELSLDAATDALHDLDAGNVRGRAILVP